MTFSTFKSVTSVDHMRKFPADFFTSDDSPPPFMIDKVLYYPIHLAAPTPTTSSAVIALLFAKVACAGSYATGVRILDTPDKLAESGIRISSQGDSLLKKVDAGETIYRDSGSHGRANFRCRADEVVRQLTLGFARLNSSELPASLTGMDYNFQNTVNQHQLKGAQLHSSVVNMYCSSTLPAPYKSGTFNTWHLPRFVSHSSGSCSINQESLAAATVPVLAKIIVRTATPTSPASVQKWRKPPRTSVWPWTLDHHWFLCEGNQISSTHHTMMGLVDSNDSNSGTTRDEISRQLPVINEQLTLDKIRKLLETYFCDLPGVMSMSGPHYSDYARENQNTRWLGSGSRWSISMTEPHHSPIVMCLAVGARPVIENGKLVKFTAAEGNLLRNTQRFHCAMSPKELNSCHSKVTMIGLYTCGLISEGVFRDLMGSCLKEHDPANEPGHVSMSLGSLVTVLIPSQSWYIETKGAMKVLINRKQLLAPLSESNLPSAEAVSLVSGDNE